MAAQQTEVLHLGGLEKTGTEKKESDPFRNSVRSSLCLEQNKDGWMGCCSKSYPWNNDHTGKTSQERLRIHVKPLRKSISTT
jgi:hypothetical protein